jgi:hypothetical protein
MAKHTKKPQSKLLVAACSVSAFLILISWSWLLLYIPPISNKAEGFLSKYLIKAQDQAGTSCQI